MGRPRAGGALVVLSRLNLVHENSKNKLYTTTTASTNMKENSDHMQQLAVLTNTGVIRWKATSLREIVTRPFDGS